MKTYTRPSIIEFGDALTTIQGCGGWGTEGFTFDDSDSKYKYITTSGRKLCVCTSLSGTSCKPILN
ncbi:hypothetical protein SB717_27355 [Priestia sp. SIMBA_032]|jgi:hypothetical protein|uniref:hypothetical protein n=1 Tax=Priestia sp. SIMBA_032 TaxID=3085775 RepID=UPI00397D8067